MVDVFDEVEEELRSAKYKRLARTWLPVLAGLLAVALVAALAWWGWQTLETNKAGKASVAYDRGLEQLQAGNAAGADAAFAEAAKEGNGAYKALALMQQAGIAANANRGSDAVALFDQAAKASRDPILKDAAALKAAYLVMDTGSAEDVEGRLEPLAAEGRPLRPFAQEALALAKLQHNKAAEARAIFVQLTLGQGVPDPLRQRAQLGIQAIDNGVAAAVPQILRAPAAPAPAAPITSQLSARPPATNQAPAAAPAPVPAQ